MGTALALDRGAVEGLVREIVSKQLAVRADEGQPTLAVHASARHMHISREHLDQLFGPGYELTAERPLYQEGNYAAKEMLTLIGPRSRLISNLRILGPPRPRTQVELALTDAASLGLEIPIRLSGDLDGTPGAILMGPKGMVEIKEGVIRAARHVHMSPEDAAHYGVAQGDRMKLRVGGEQGLTFEDVQVRIGEGYRLDVHLDTDEANACALNLTKDIELFK